MLLMVGRNDNKTTFLKVNAEIKTSHLNPGEKLMRIFVHNSDIFETNDSGIRVIFFLG